MTRTKPGKFTVFAHYQPHWFHPRPMRTHATREAAIEQCAELNEWEREDNPGSLFTFTSDADGSEQAYMNAWELAASQSEGGAS